MKTPALALVILSSMSSVAWAQGTFIYDQQSVLYDSLNPSLSYRVQTEQPLGESFTPTLPEVGFVRLFVLNAGEATSPGTIHVNLLGNGISGPVLGQSESISLPGGKITAIPIDFFFQLPVSVTPGDTYYFQPIVDDNTNVAVGAGNYGYSPGTAFINGAPVSYPVASMDLWFREGIYVVPEPSPVWLALLGGDMIFCFRTRSRRRARGMSEGVVGRRHSEPSARGSA